MAAVRPGDPRHVPDVRRAGAPPQYEGAHPLLAGRAAAHGNPRPLVQAGLLFANRRFFLHLRPEGPSRSFPGEQEALRPELLLPGIGARKRSGRRGQSHPGLSDFTRRAAAGYWGMIEWLELRILTKVLKRNYRIYMNSLVLPSLNPSLGVPYFETQHHHHYPTTHH